MQLCLIRHAIAVERGSGSFEDDRARPLTPEGRKRMSEAAKGLARIFEPEAIVTSPVLRARQTADILATVFSVPVRPLEGLGNGDHIAVLAACGAARETSLALVGHEPWMSELLSVLLSGDPGAVAATFKKGTGALVSTHGPPAPGGATLEWLLQPAALRRLAAG
jgi:phosphohistidine phosphatase